VAWTEAHLHAFWVENSGGPTFPVGRGNFEGSTSPRKGTILRGKRRLIVMYSDTLRSSVQKPEPIDMPFGVWGRVCPRNHVLDGSRSPVGRGNFKEGAIVKYMDSLP